MWLVGLPNAPVAPSPRYPPLWQVSHLVAVTTVWFMRTDVANATCELWQESHLVGPVVTGTWVADLPNALVPLWQVSQVPVPTALAAEWVYCTLSQLVVERWQDSQLPVTEAWVAVAGLEVSP